MSNIKDIIAQKVSKKITPAMLKELNLSKEQLVDQLAERVEANLKKEDKEPYGEVEYADPGYRSDKQKRYPIDTEEHIRAAWNYINQEHNSSFYTAEQVDHIKRRIVAAWRDKIDPKGPPGAEDKHKNLTADTIVLGKDTTQDSITMTENTTPESAEVKSEELKAEVTSYGVSADWKEDFQSMKDAISAVHAVVQTLAESMTGLENKMKDLHETTIPSILMQLSKSGEKPEEVEEKAETKPADEEEDCMKALQKEIEKLHTKLDVYSTVATDGMKALLLNEGEDAPVNNKVKSKYWMYDRFSVDGGQQ